MSKPYLEENEIERARGCCRNILDKYRALEKEISESERPYKHYLLEKLDSIAWDVKCIQSMCKGDEEDV